MIDAHRGAFEYEWRARFSLPLSAIGKSMSWGEAIRLATVLAHDSSSWLTASLNGWDYPFSHESQLLADVFDLNHAVANQGKKQKPHPLRPKAQRQTERLGKKQVLSQDAIYEVLRKAGHDLPIPTREPEVSRG